MKNKNIEKALLTAVSTAFLLSALVSCSQTDKDGREELESETEEMFTPAEDGGELSELGERYNEYMENMSLAFKGYEPMAESAFEYEAVENGVRIVRYIGSDQVIVVPEVIAGEIVTEIAAAAFSGGGVGAVYIPDTVKSIAKGAFEDCEGLTTLRLPMIGDGGENPYLGYIFGADEPQKNAVTVPASLDMVIVGESCDKVENEAFRGVKTVSAVAFEGEISSVGIMAFYQCSDLVAITLETVTGEIGELAFASCTSLYYADISNAAAESGAFYLCTNINGIKLNLSDGEYLGRIFGAESADFNDEFVPTSLRSVEVGDKTDKIPDRAFTGCKYLTEISFSDNVKSIGVRAFYACRSLSAVKMPDGLLTVDDDAFFGCDNLKRVEFGSSLESIGMQAFFGCERLEDADVGEGVNVGNNAFGNCPRLDQ